MMVEDWQRWVRETVETNLRLRRLFSKSGK